MSIKKVRRARFFTKYQRFCVQATLAIGEGLHYLYDLGLNSETYIVVTHLSITGLAAIPNRSITIGDDHFSNFAIKYGLQRPNNGQHDEVNFPNGFMLSYENGLAIKTVGGTGPAVHVVAEGYLLKTSGALA